MKKLMVFALVAACAVQLQAATTTYTFRQMNNPYSSGAALTKADLAYLNVYGLSAADVTDLTGIEVLSGKMSSKATAKAQAELVADWIAKNFSTAYAAWSEGIDLNTGKTLASLDSGKYQKSTYKADGTLANTWESLQYVVDFYYGEGEDYNLEEGQAAFRVAVLKSAANYIDGIEGSGADYVGWSKWQTVDVVPEPTSGMLLLLGVAGLMLKRKRA